MNDEANVDSVSVMSGGSGTSVSSAIAMTRARKAALLVKQKHAEERAHLERLQLETEQRKQQLDVQSDIEAADAEEKVLVEAEAAISGAQPVSITSVEGATAMPSQPLSAFAMPFQPATVSTEFIFDRAQVSTTSKSFDIRPRENLPPPDNVPPVCAKDPVTSKPFDVKPPDSLPLLDSVTHANVKDPAMSKAFNVKPPENLHPLESVPPVSVKDPATSKPFDVRPRDAFPPIDASAKYSPAYDRFSGVPSPMQNVGQNASALKAETASPFSHQQRQSCHPAFATTFQSPPNQPLPAESIQQLAALTVAATLPKTEILTFDSDPKNYVEFITNFKINVESKVYEQSVLLNYLISYCTGEAKHLIKNCVLLGDQGYTRALELLNERYGRRNEIARSCIDSLMKGHIVKGNDSRGLIALSDEMERCALTLQSLGYESDLNCTPTLKAVVMRLPNYIRIKWAEFVYSFSHLRDPTFNDLRVFVKQRAGVAMSTYGEMLRREEITVKKPKHTTSKTVSTVMTTQAKNQGTKQKLPDCTQCRGQHFIAKCAAFLQKTYADIVKVIKDKRLCFNCLRPGHVAKECRKDSKCSHCKSKHHELVHDTNYRRRLEEKRNEQHRESTPTDSSSVNCVATRTPQVCLRIVPVIIRGNVVDVETYALLDEGSDTTLCTESLLKRLRLRGKTAKLNLSTVTSANVSKPCTEVSLTVASLDQTGAIDIDRVFSVENLPISMRAKADDVAVSQWPHLSGLKFPCVNSSQVDLLIGANVPEAFWKEDERRGSVKEPYAVKSVLGWSLLGPLDRTVSNTNARVNFQQGDLQSQVERMWKTDFDESIYSAKSGMSLADKQALSIFDESIEHTGERYMLSLPWRTGVPKLESNLPLAVTRLNYLERKFSKKESLHEAYSSALGDYVTKGYAQKVGTLEEHAKDVNCWYLPHHPVINPNKPDKIRIVFDCAAKYRGTSLNDCLLQGPDLVNPLLGVLLRFRQEPIAIVGDIEAMFHQVQVLERDRDYLRFLWWQDGDIKLPPEVYAMIVHIFGATSSPSATAFAMRKTATDNQCEFDAETVKTVLRNFYVDDCLKSIPTVPQAIRLTAQLQELLQRGGFHLTKLFSNNREVLLSIPVSERAPSVASIDIDDALPYERALGLRWNVEDDTLTYNVKSVQKPMTRRGILSVVSSLYDPLGLAAPVTLIPKMLLQGLCKDGYAWDESIAHDASTRFREWQDTLSSLSNYSVDRCYKPDGLMNDFTCELHHFADASEVAYGVASYLRIYDTSGHIKCSLVAGKSRLAPIKSVTIPRLELSAAVVAARLHQMISSELEFEISQAYFWTDSTAVLKYIRNTKTRFQAFVANRLSVIHDITRPEDWYYVPSKQNPADLASRGISPRETSKLKFWASGPMFLWDAQIMMPAQPDYGDPGATVACLTSEIDPLSSLINRCSSWSRLCVSFAWLLRYVAFCLVHYAKATEKLPQGNVGVEEIHRARAKIIAIVQRECYTSELTRLNEGVDVLRTSPIAKLSPVLTDNIIRVGGRLDEASVDYDFKHPIILPKKHHVTELIIRHIHERNGHVGLHQVLALTRKEYWITQGAAAVKRVIGACFFM